MVNLMDRVDGGIEIPVHDQTKRKADQHREHPPTQDLVFPAWGSLQQALTEGGDRSTMKRSTTPLCYPESSVYLQEDTDKLTARPQEGAGGTRERDSGERT